MVSKCANPECNVPLQYLRDGKVFRIEVQELSPEGSEPFITMAPKKPMKRVEHFWLCGECSKTMSVSFDGQQHVMITPKERPLYRRAAAS